MNSWLPCKKDSQAMLGELVGTQKVIQNE
jgi:hypothetical protein